MQVARQIEDVAYEKNSAITVGTFDGVHIAHQKIIREVVAEAKKREGRSVVVTFEPHPREVISAPEEVKLLTTLDERRRICESLGVDCFLVLTFNKEFSQLGFRQFYVDYVVKAVGVAVVVEGFDHHWGRNREGNIDALTQLGAEFGFAVVSIAPFTAQGKPVNSSLIRHALQEGGVDRAADWLGRPYALEGKVVSGDKRGRLLGYPTANLELESKKKLIPKDGIYFVSIELEEKRHFGMASIGVRPTFQSNGKRTIEAYIFDFDREIYGCEIQLGFLRRLRDELKYNSADELVRQMRRDEDTCRDLQSEYGKNQ